MISLRRISISVGACCLLAAVIVPVVALAHGGAGGRHGHARVSAFRWDRHVRRLCGPAAVGLSGGGHGFGHYRRVLPAYRDLSETQQHELQSACEKLAAAYKTERGAVRSAAKTWHETVQAARATLEGACPRPLYPIGPSGASGPTGPTGLGGPSQACKEARHAYREALRAADKTYREAASGARTAFGKALEEFDATVKAILAAATGRHHHHHVGTTGPTGPVGLGGHRHGHQPWSQPGGPPPAHHQPVGPTGPTGPTGATGPTGPSQSGGWQAGNGQQGSGGFEGEYAGHEGRRRGR